MLRQIIPIPSRPLAPIAFFCGRLADRWSRHYTERVGRAVEILMIVAYPSVEDKIFDPEERPMKRRR
jgi:hypothetical protein